jgi:hypothetical protein
MALPAAAEVSDTTLLVAVRALSFLQHPLQGEVVVGIVYQPVNAQSLLEARHLDALMEDGFRAGRWCCDRNSSRSMNWRFQRRAVLPDLQARPAAAPLAQLNRSRKIPCVTTDIAQVRDGNCAMGVRALPRVEILVNRAAAAATGMTFSEAFRVMITEL